MKFNDFLQRANLNSLQTFLKYGAEDFKEQCEKTYSERLKEAEKNAMDFFKTRCIDDDELDKITGYFEEQVNVYEEVYFEIGMILGAKIAFQLGERMEELK